jgi:hypothetical protein
MTFHFVDYFYCMYVLCCIITASLTVLTLSLIFSLICYSFYNFFEVDIYVLNFSLSFFLTYPIRAMNFLPDTVLPSTHMFQYVNILNY